MNIILASKSPRRRELMKMLGIPFEAADAKTDEPPYAGGPVENYVRMLAERKARAVFEREPERWVIGADTVVYCNGRILGKPHSAEEAHAFLGMLSGNAHTVYTGVALIGPDYADIRHDSASVVFEPMTDEEIEGYIRTGEPLDKAGAYGIQGRGGIFVRKIDGNYYTVVGLPLPVVYSMLKKADLTGSGIFAQ